MSTRRLSWPVRAVALCCLLSLAACSQTGKKKKQDGAASPDGDPARTADFSPPPAPALPGASDFDDDVGREREDFLFSDPDGGRARGVRSRAAADHWLADPADETPVDRDRRDGAARSRARPRGPTGPSIAVTWEALAREKYLLENSRFKRRGPQPPQKITLLNRSHPDAKSVAAGRASRLTAQYGHTAVLSDQDMQQLLRGLRQGGFYKHARDVGNRSSALSDENSRGRVTIVQNGNARTLISMRGQGRDARTKDIPRIYSEAKQAIMVLQNMTPTLNVSHVGRDPIRR